MKIWRQKSLKNDPKMTPYKLLQKRSKIDMPWGGRKCQKSTFLGRGVPGGGFYKFFEILSLFAKTFRFWTPINDPYKNVIPHK
jgi:hypothetical protein